MDLQLAGKVVIITGAAGGIGRALADAFAEEGARLVLHAHRSYAALQELAAQRWAAHEVLTTRADVRKPQEMQAVMDRALARFGRVDVCVANAGIWPHESQRLDEMPAARVRETLEVNLLGAIWTARGFLSALARCGPHADREGASVTFIGSTAGRFGERGHCDYATSKAALYGLLRSLKNEIVALDPYGRVNMIEPGWTATPMARGLDQTGGVARVVRTTPVQQIARPVDIARGVVFLASPAAARHITGEILTVAGGMEGRLQWEAHQVDEDAVRRRLS
jgi:3-oxoacyl-[acyl-carrier protein] reductase